MSIKSNMIAGLIAVATAFGFGSSALAQVPGVTNSASQTVHYQDLNLSTPNGVQALYRRIRIAAAAECGQLPSTPNYLYVTCTTTATDAAVRAVNNAALTAIHKSNRALPLLVSR